MNESKKQIQDKCSAEMQSEAHKSAQPMLANDADGEEREDGHGSGVDIINRLHNEIHQATKFTAEKAIQLGEKLIELKEHIGHGGWLKYIKENLEFSDKSAQRYIRLAENKEELMAKFATVSNFSLSDAYRIVADRHGASKKQEVSNDGQKEENGKKGEILTALTRSLLEGLERLSVQQLSEFQTASIKFKETWLKNMAGHPSTGLGQAVADSVTGRITEPKDGVLLPNGEDTVDQAEADFAPNAIEAYE